MFKDILSYKFFFFSTCLVMVLLCLVPSCRQSFDSKLTAADSMMELNPDSTLLILSGYKLTSQASAADSAYYALLLTHARYKNFIDETDDSLISRSVAYFEDKHENELAARALFLQGMIQLNDNRLGEAAVSFRKGLEIARKDHIYMWEGQCASGLYLLYGKLLDGSAQVDYARQSYDAFVRTQDKEWMAYSKLELARALHNNFRYEESLALSGQLYEAYSATDNIHLLSEIEQLRALSLFATGKYQESIYAYNKVKKLNPLLLSENDVYNLEVAIHEVCKDTVCDDGLYAEILQDLPKLQEAPFVLLAKQEKYKDAYNSLMKYRFEQDSVLSVIMKNSVAESMNQFSDMERSMQAIKTRNNNLTYWIIILLILIIGIIIIWRYRERLNRELTLRLTTEANMESLRSDFLAQLDKSRNVDGKNKGLPNGVTKDFIKNIRQRYAETNRLCDYYYQGQVNRTEREKISSQIKMIIKDFSDKSYLQKVGEYIDEQSEGLYSSFNNDFFNYSEEDHRLFLFLLLGFSSRTISVMIGQETKTVYNRKSRLKAKIENSNVARKKEYMEFFQKMKI